ncbi:MAG: hypothetical protein FWH20_01555 [Oscillospiraceae bacterium]|nr:hypothetical protein [Oscillospiraceae bacterium]
MTDAERLEYESLVSEYNRLVGRYNNLVNENAVLEAELNASIRNVNALISECNTMHREVFGLMDGLSGKVGEAEIDTKDVFDELTQLTSQYFTFKNVSAASKNLTQFTDEYHTKFHYYNELRRITLGYVIGIDSHIISSENARKKVEKAYLQNTEYWLAYSIMAVMLWASDEREAAERAMNKSLSMNYFNTCLFFLLINLRFNRIETARKWYLNYLDRVDMNNLSDEWQYLLQAYLSGAFGADAEFQEQIAICFKRMMAQTETATVDFGKKISDKALLFAQVYLHSTEQKYNFLRKNCTEYDEMLDLLSSAEKNAVIAKYYNTLAEISDEESDNLAERIENVLYALISDYDDDEMKVVQNLKLNEAVVAAKGDIGAAQAKYNEMFANNKNKSLADLFLQWAFDEGASQTGITVKRFAITFMKERIANGLARFAEIYRKNEKTKYNITVDECALVCSENDFETAKLTLEKHYDKRKFKNIFKDKFVKIYIFLCLVALIIIAVMFFVFSKIALTLGILIGLVGSFLLWRRIVDVGKILLEKKRKGILLLKQTLDELKQWREDYKEADSKHVDLLNAIEKFN